MKASLEQGHAVASWRTVCSSDDGTVLIEGQVCFSPNPTPRIGLLNRCTAL